MGSVPLKTFVIIGAGPKGLAVALKAKILSEFGFPMDKIILVEKHQVAAHWTGQFGYTNGEMKLGTSPEKDLVFPLETDVGDPVLNQKIRSRSQDFTWTSFLVQTSRFSNWIDRGRPAPCHGLWAEYLGWVAKQLAPEIGMLRAEVERIDLASEKNQWKMTLKIPNQQARSEIFADRLMLTGPGKTRFGQQVQQGPGVLDLKTFWSSLKAGKFSTQGKLGIVGAGENAASVLLALSKIAPDFRVEVISPTGFVSTRAENFYENQFYSQPEKSGWADLAKDDREEFVRRTDLGVFSMHAMKILNDEIHHRIVPGRMKAIARTKTDQIQLQIDYNGRSASRIYDQVILATGFDQVSLIQSLFSEKAYALLHRCCNGNVSDSSLGERISRDLSVQDIRPSLYLPMLAGRSQGPGFANLSCLGKLSDRVVIGLIQQSDQKTFFQTELMSA